MKMHITAEEKCPCELKMHLQEHCALFTLSFKISPPLMQISCSFAFSCNAGKSMLPQFFPVYLEYSVLKVVMVLTEPCMCSYLPRGLEYLR